MEMIFETYGQTVLAVIGGIAVMTMAIYFTFNGPLAEYILFVLSSILS